MDKVSTIKVGEITCLYREAWDGTVVLTPEVEVDKLVFEQEYCLPLHMLKWTGIGESNFVNLVIVKEEGSDSSHLIKALYSWNEVGSDSMTVEIPGETEKLVVWQGSYFFAAYDRDDKVIRLYQLPENYKPKEGLPRMR